MTAPCREDLGQPYASLFGCPRCSRPEVKRRADGRLYRHRNALSVVSLGRRGGWCLGSGEKPMTTIKIGGDLL